MPKSMHPRADDGGDLAALVTELLEEVSEPPPYPPGHLRVLREAMQLMAERGYSAASLRELARRLEMRQPSLYHYFRSKEELVEQIVRAYTQHAMQPLYEPPPMPSLAEGLRHGLLHLVENYRREEHVTFMRFLFAIGPERPQVQSLARRLLRERGQALVKRFVDFYVGAGELGADDSAFLVELTQNAVAMRMLSQHVLFGTDGSTADDDEAFVEFVVDCALRGVRARMQEAGAA